jgi:hypothetical protein
MPLPGGVENAGHCQNKKAGAHKGNGKQGKERKQPHLKRSFFLCPIPLQKQ